MKKTIIEELGMPLVFLESFQWGGFKFIFLFNWIFNDENYSKFNISHTLCLKISKSLSLVG